MKRIVASSVATALACGALAVVGTVVADPAEAAGRTLRVPASYPTISAGIAAAHSGDTVLVSPGVYRENIAIIGKYVQVIAAAYANPALTVIAGHAGKTPVMIQNVPARGGVVVKGFNIVSGSAPEGQGGGITIANNASPTITNNYIQSSHSHDGGGVLIYNHSNPRILFNLIRNNSASKFGGGVFAVIGSSPEVYGNVITGNRAYGGGGVYFENNVANPASRSVPTLIKNSITGNSSSQAGGGVMLRTGVNANIYGNNISGNASPYGGGMEVETTGSYPLIGHNKISANISNASPSQPGGGSGGGIAVFGHSHPLISKNSIYGNRSSHYGAGIVLAEGSVSTVTSNMIFSNKVTGSSAGSAGGGIFAANADSTSTNNVVRQNIAPLGGGFAYAGTGSWVLENNTIVSNAATQGGYGAGGGLFISKKTSGKASVVNNIISSNNDYQVFEGGRFATYSSNLITASGRGAFFSFPAHALTDISRINGNLNVVFGAGNVGASPAFVNSLGRDYRINRSSAAIDKGRDLGAPSLDVRGAHRYGRGPDIGAYEYVP